MSILNEASDGTLAVLMAFCNALRAYGAMSAEALLSLCAPETAVDDNKARPTLTRWTDLGAFVEQGRRIGLAPELARIPVGAISETRAALMQLILRKQNCPDGNETESGEEKTYAADFSRAASWALLQDPYAFPTSYDRCFEMQVSQKLVREEQEAPGGGVKLKPTVIVNSTRWMPFCRWATFLGFAVGAPRGILVNPAFALTSVLDEIMKPGTTLPARQFLAAAAEFVPVMPGGAYSQRVARDMMAPWREFGPHEVPPAVSLALLQLREARVLAVTQRSDKDVMTLLGRNGRKCGEVSEIERVAP